VKTRPAARLLIIDPEDRILLFKADNFPLAPELQIATYWYVPGGAVERGETYEEAARRELWEETSIHGVEIGPCVWMREQVLEFPNIGRALAQERFFLVRVEDNEISFDNMIDMEATVMTEHRWWTLEALRATDDVVFPVDIASLLAPILRHEYPSVPLPIR
jgi:ADP-ribose pyrophosphatase YjhB (NUDIX family)